MDLRPDQHFVYAWRYTDDTVCKLGVSTPRTFYARIKAAKTVTHQEIELLGIETFSTEAAARSAYQHYLQTFPRLNGRRAWVHLTDAVSEWVKTECLPNPPSLEAFKEMFQNDPVRREKEREYQHRASEKRAVKRRQKRTGRTEKDRAYDREYQRKRRASDPEYKEKQKQRQQAWRAKNPDYDKIGMPTTRHTPSKRRLHAEKSMPKTRSIANARNNAARNSQKTIPTIRKSDARICGSGERRIPITRKNGIVKRSQRKNE